MNTKALPFLGQPLILQDEAGNGVALGTSAADPAFLCAVIQDVAGRAIIANLIDAESEAFLLELLHQRQAIRAAAAVPSFRGDLGGAGRT
ncbi:hypothetical protein [Roseomonas sp. KE0001]|uniref:hypothetical protein n=1 Tax=Roseomonas sp. KE0001 TaxID=2479201 RepID=UPI0018DFB838|nr:hypothetical protein [Roseomonas sp. KE0001]MBI0435866.1 hypothetical protein [Roseomonas sp. KE0001]